MSSLSSLAGSIMSVVRLYCLYLHLVPPLPLGSTESYLSSSTTPFCSSPILSTTLMHHTFCVELDTQISRYQQYLYFFPPVASMHIYLATSLEEIGAFEVSLTLYCLIVSFPALPNSSDKVCSTASVWTSLLPPKS